MRFGPELRMTEQHSFFKALSVTRKVRGPGSSGLNTAASRINQVLWSSQLMPSFSPNYEASPIKGINESPSLSSALTKRKVYPGDSITSTFTQGSGGWTDSWSLSPGSAGASAGQISQSGSSSNTFGK